MRIRERRVRRTLIGAALLVVAAAGVALAVLLPDGGGETVETRGPTLQERFGRSLLASGDLGDGGEWGAVRRGSSDLLCVSIRNFARGGQEEVIDDGCFKLRERATSSRVAQVPGIGYVVFGRLQSEGAFRQREVSITTSGSSRRVSADENGLFAAFTPTKPLELSYETTRGEQWRHRVEDEAPPSK